MVRLRTSLLQPEAGSRLSFRDSEPVSRTSVSEVRSILSSFNIPAELVLHIMDVAEYHLTLCTERRDHAMIAPAGWHNDTGEWWAAQLYLVSKPLPRRVPGDLFWKVKKVVWELEGHDQPGWADEHEGTGYRYRIIAYPGGRTPHNDRSHRPNFQASTSGPAPGSKHASSDLFKPMP